MLALLWVPVTSHCLFERLPGLEFLSCCTHPESSSPHENEDCSDDACAIVEGGGYKLKDNGDVIPKPALEIAFLSLTSEAMVKDSGGEPLRAASPPPHLAPAWQFIFRVALPVRAPSLA